MWQEWEPDPEAEALESGSLPVLWCWGWTEDREQLAQALFRLGFCEFMGGADGAWQNAERAELDHGWVCSEDGTGDERTLYELRSGATGVDPKPATFVRLQSS
jgi:hypothetical protein